MNAQSKIQVILSEVFNTVTVGEKLANRKSFLGIEERGYPVVADGEKFSVRSVKHAEQIVADEMNVKADRERATKYAMTSEEFAAKFFKNS